MRFLFTKDIKHKNQFKGNISPQYFFLKHNLLFKRKIRQKKVFNNYIFSLSFWYIKVFANIRDILECLNYLKILCQNYGAAIKHRACRTSIERIEGFWTRLLEGRVLHKGAWVATQVPSSGSRTIKTIKFIFLKSCINKKKISHAIQLRNLTFCARACLSAIVRGFNYISLVCLKDITNNF